ncbi:MAG: MAPEG family protein [Pseudomonadota bacterium]
MPELTITLTAASILGLMFVWLSVRVIMVRTRNQAIIGDAGNQELLYAIRAHGNFCEYAPIFLILLALLEATGGNSSVLAPLAALFVVARLLHVPGMGAEANLRLRQAGIVGSFTAIIVASAYGLYLVFSG